MLSNLKTFAIETKIENGFPHLQYETATDQNCHILFQVTKKKRKKIALFFFMRDLSISVTNSKTY